MEQNPSLDDLALFVAIADAGGLAGAARATGVSVPTLSRRMTRFEQQMGRNLFARGARGYALTGAGRALLSEAEGLRDVAARLSRFPAQRGDVAVRITTGHWTAMYLAHALPRVWRPDAGWRPHFLTANAFVDIARREADIGIRNQRPDQPWMAGQRFRRIRFAPFAADLAVAGFIAVETGEDLTASERWLREERGEAIVATASSARLAADLALAGVGQIVLPTFVAPLMPGLMQTGPEIADLGFDEWLVSHHEARHDPPVRAALDAIGAILSDRAGR